MKTLIQAAVTTLFAASTAQAQQAVQWKVEDGGNGHWYQLIALPGQGTMRISWGEAKLRAETQSGHLATLTSIAEGAFIWQSFNSQMIDTVWGSPWCCWLGGYRVSGQTFAWVTGEPYSCETMCGSPCEGGGEDALYTGQGPGPVSCVDFHSAGFQGGKPYYLVEWSADCNSDGIVDYGQILQGQLADTNADGVPDICQVPTCVDADLFRDFTVNGADLGILLSQWGPVTSMTVSDINGDGVVSGADLGLLLSFWGACP
jgi:hypothetical protein